MTDEEAKLLERVAENCRSKSKGNEKEYAASFFEALRDSDSMAEGTDLDSFRDGYYAGAFAMMKYFGFRDQDSIDKLHEDYEGTWRSP
jgi:hypothetical protein